MERLSCKQSLLIIKGRIVHKKGILVSECSKTIFLLHVNLNLKTFFGDCGVDMYECDYSIYACLLL
jgi:hypothetical protein